jgi:hypothetical protein
VIPAFINPDAGNAENARSALWSAEATRRGPLRHTRSGPLSAFVEHRSSHPRGRSARRGCGRRWIDWDGCRRGRRIRLSSWQSFPLAHSTIWRKIFVCRSILSKRRALHWGGRAVNVDGATVNGRLFLSTSSVGAYVTFVRARERIEPRVGYHIASAVALLRLLCACPCFA